MKIVFMGTPDFAVLALRKLHEAGHEITLVVTQPDKPKGRSKLYLPSPVKEEAMRLGIEVFQPDRIKKEENVEVLKKYPADVFVVAAFGQILSKEILEMPRYGCINIHASLLPMYRGAAPIQWAILNGEKKSGDVIDAAGVFYNDSRLCDSRSNPSEDTSISSTYFTEDRLKIDALQYLRESKVPNKVLTGLKAEGANRHDAFRPFHFAILDALLTWCIGN